MANKVVILGKGQTVGLEYPLDVDTGTDLRDLCYEGGGQFWFARDPNFIVHYRLDPIGNTMRKLAGDNITIANGSDAWGMATDGQKLFFSGHNLRAGTHNNQLIMMGKGGSSAATFNQDTGAGDAGNRLKGIDCIGDRLVYVYQGAGNSVLRTIRFNTATPSTINQLGLGATGFVGVAFDRAGAGFWVLGASNLLNQIDLAGNVIETYTIGNSGTARGICDMGDGRLAISMI